MNEGEGDLLFDDELRYPVPLMVATLEATPIFC